MAKRLNDRLGVLGENREARGGHICETAAHVEHQRVVAFVGLHAAFLQRGHERRVTEQHAEVAFRPRRVDLVDLAREQLALRRDQRKVQLGGSPPLHIQAFQLARGPVNAIQNESRVK